MPPEAVSARSNDPPKTLRRAVNGGVSRIGALVKKQETIALIDQAVVSATNFLTNLLVAKYCLPYEFGIFYLAISLLHFVRGIQEQLVSAPYTIYYHRRDEQSLPRYAGSTLVHQALLLALILAALGVLTWTLGMHPGSTDLAMAIQVLLVAAPFFLFREYVRKLLFAHFQFHAAALLDILVAVVQLAAIGVLVWFGGMTVVRVFFCIAVASLCAIAIWYARFRLPMALDRQAVRHDWRENWSFGRWALATHVVGSSTPFFMPWFIKFMCDEVVTAKYGACQTLVGLGNMLLVGVSNFLSPKSARAYAMGGTSGLWPVLMQAVLLFGVTLGPFCALLALTDDWIPRTLFSSDYAGLGRPLVYLALALLAAALGMTAGNGLWALDRPSLNMSADLACLLVTFGLGYVWIPQSYAEGAAAAVLAGASVAAALRWAILLWLMERAGRTDASNVS